MPTCFSGYTRRDWFIAWTLVLVLFFTAGLQLSPGMGNWGDDFAAYISEGIAIATGTLEEQAVRNYVLHPAQLLLEASEEGLVYVWGHPLLLSLVYRLRGFDRTDFSDIFFYKLPSLAALSLTAGVAYLYYRRRFNWKLSLFLSVVLCFHSQLILSTDHLHVDVLFLFVFLLSVLLSDCFLDCCTELTGRSILLALLLGVAMWYTCMTRLNGPVIVLVVLSGHGIRLLRCRSQGLRAPVPLQLLPYAALASVWLAASLFLPAATSNLSDVGRVDGATILENIRYYLLLMKQYADAILGVTKLPFWLVWLILAALGLYRKALTPENLPLTAMTAGSFLVLILLPYTQGLRYLFNVLPVILLFVGYGSEEVCQRLCRRFPGKPLSALLWLPGVAAVVLILAGNLQKGLDNQLYGPVPAFPDVYSSESMETYHYIQEHIPEEAVVAFCKPRALFLNTGRMSFRLGYNGHMLEDADYFLFCAGRYEEDDWEAVTCRKEALRLIWSNEYFLLYEVIR